MAETAGRPDDGRDRREAIDPGGGRASGRREKSVRLVLIGAWLAFGLSSTIWLPIYNGTADLESLALIYVAIAIVAAFAVRGQAPDPARAILSALPGICLVAVAGLAAALLNDPGEADRGEPLYLYFGSALLASWATMTLLTAVGARTRWDRPGGLLLTLVVAAAGLELMTVRID